MFAKILFVINTIANWTLIIGDGQTLIKESHSSQHMVDVIRLWAESNTVYYNNVNNNKIILRMHFMLIVFESPFLINEKFKNNCGEYHRSSLPD